MMAVSIFNSKQICFSLAGVVLCVLFCSNGAYAQRKDHLTSEEIELIRFHQNIDKRMDVYVKAVERRFLVINGTGSLTPKEHKNLEKDTKKWGELPKGSQTKMLSDIDGIIDEAINKIDDVASRDPKSDLFKSAVHILAENAQNFITRLNDLADKTGNVRERALISSTISNCNDIIAASARVKNPSQKKKKKKRS